MKRYIFGFCSLRDIFTTIFSKNWSLMGTLSAISVWCAHAAGFLHSDVNVIYILFILMLLDWLTGSIKALKQKNFNSFTFQRFFLNLVARFGLIGLAHHIGMLYWVFNLLKISDILAVGFILTEFVSLLENLAVIEPRLIPAPLMSILRQVTSIDKVLKRLYPDVFSEPEAPAAEAPNAVPTEEPATIAGPSGECADKVG